MFLPRQSGLVTKAVLPASPPTAVNDSVGPFEVDSGNHDIDALDNDSYSGTPSVEITAQSGPGTATVVGSGAASRIRLPTDGVDPGDYDVTYQLMATGSAGTDTASLTCSITAVGGGQSGIAPDTDAPLYGATAAGAVDTNAPLHGATADGAVDTDAPLYGGKDPP